MPYAMALAIRHMLVALVLMRMLRRSQTVLPVDKPVGRTNGYVTSSYGLIPQNNTFTILGITTPAAHPGECKYMSTPI